MASSYFFLYLKEPIYNLIGILAILPVVAIHFIFIVPAIHSEIKVAILIGLCELSVILISIYLFHKYIVKLKN